MHLSAASLSRLKKIEGFRAYAYIPVPGDKPTIGYGFTSRVKLGDKMSVAQADSRLLEELEIYEKGVYEACTLTPNQNQFDAMTLLAFNIGVPRFAKSTVLKAHNRGDQQAAARAFSLWNKAGGVVYLGLTRRRALEAALYLTGVDKVKCEMPQTVDAESPMLASPINKAGALAAGTAGLAGVSEFVRLLGNLKNDIAQMRDFVLPLALAAVVVACIYCVWNRFQQRKGGWA